MAFTRITALWTGATGLPGYSRFKFSGELNSADALSAANRVKTFFQAFQLYLPSAVSIGFSEAAQVFGSDGKLTSEVQFTPPTAIGGTASGNFSSPTGMVCHWLTGAVVDGRKVRGRTFIVPMAATAFSLDGSPSSAAVTALTSAGQALMGGTPPLVIFGKTQIGGFVTATVTGATVPDRAVILRSRRD